MTSDHRYSTPREVKDMVTSRRDDATSYVAPNGVIYDRVPSQYGRVEEEDRPGGGAGRGGACTQGPGGGAMNAGGGEGWRMGQGKPHFIHMSHWQNNVQ